MKKRKISWPMRFFILCIVCACIVIVGLLWWNDGLSPVDEHDETPITFAVKKGDSVREIASKLSSERLIRSKTVFFLLIKMKSIDDKLQAGDFQIKKSMNAEDIAYSLTHGSIDQWVTILEGWRIEEIATKLTEELKIPEQEFIAVAHEGYMFPDTYLLPKTATSGAVTAILQANFDKRITPEMKQLSTELGLTFDQVVVLASLVEREGRTSDDRPMIAGILLNRLKKGMSLDVDATLQYVLGYDVREKTWWRKAISNDDKKIDSPYNTYKNVGLPPRPISNPGLSSISAVLHATPSEYFYYLHDSQGIAHYSKTLEEHEANAKKYIQ